MMSITITNNASTIWKFLKANGLTDSGCAGLMGNLYAESALEPNNLQNSYERSLGYTDATYTAAVDNGTYKNFVRDSAGYGLAQWTYYTRKQGLLDYARASNRSIGDLKMQLEYLIKELSGEFSSVLGVLRTTGSVSDASDAVVLKFERPADQSASALRRRASYGMEFYDHFSNEKNASNMQFSNSPLVVYTKRSPMNSGRRTHIIDTISIHCMAGNLSVETCGEIFQTKEASSNYGIGSDGRIALYVDEANRSWCTSNAANDNRAVTIEVANTVAADPWPVSDKAYDALISLLVDICWRNGIKRLLWRGDKNLIGQVDKQNMTVHRWFAAKACPGDWLYDRHGQIASEVNAILEEKEKEQEKGDDDDEMTQEQFNEMFAIAMKEYRKSLQDNDAAAWSAADRQWAIDNKLFIGSGTLPNGEPNYMWDDFLNRQQAAAVYHRFYDTFIKK